MQQQMKQGVASHLVNRTSGAHALAGHPSHGGPHANSQAIRQKDHHLAASPALQNNFTAMTAIQ